MLRTLSLTLILALAAASCSGSDSDAAAHENPERAVVAWFEAIDAGDTDTASASVHEGSLAIILGIENSLDDAETAAYLSEGVPRAVLDDYWTSFSDGFSEFASRPVSTLTVGASSTFDAEGDTFARVPVSGGASTESVVYTRMRDDGTWEVDLVATLGDGFVTLLADRYSALAATEDAATIRDAYTDIVVPGIWAAITDGQFGDEFNRAALTLVSEVDG